jgi:CheY-like chemotaxis protein
MELENLYVLIAEDDVDDAEFILESFSKFNQYGKVKLVENGRQLIDELGNKNELQPDLILTDINMPLMDGLQALRQINQSLALKDIPKFVYSTSINEKTKTTCQALGVKGCIIKPTSLLGYQQIPLYILKSMVESRNKVYCQSY